MVYIFLAALPRTRPAVAPGLTLRSSGLLIVLAAAFLIPVRLIQEANPDWRLLSWAMALSVGLITACGIYLSGGRRWLRHFAFPILFFFVAVPWPTNLEQFVIQGLMRLDALLNVEVLNAIGIPAVQLGNVIEVGSGYVGIDEACTGIRSLQATFMVSLFLGEFYEFAVLRRIILWSWPVRSSAFFCNLVRTFLWSALGAEHGFRDDQELARPGGAHNSHDLSVRSLGIERCCAAKTRPHRRQPRSPQTCRMPRLVLGILLALTIFAEAGTQIWYRVHEAHTARLDPWTVTWPSRRRIGNRCPSRKARRNSCATTRAAAASGQERRSPTGTCFSFAGLGPHRRPLHQESPA